MKASVFIATSLDGFIARKDGDIDWLDHTEDHEVEHEQDDQGFFEFFDSVDCLVMGRNSYEKVLSIGEWYYGSKPVVVLTNRPLDIPAEHTTVQVMSGTPMEIVAKLSDRGFQHLYIDGGKTIQAFLDAGLIGRLIITTIPVLLGEGIPLFGALQKDIRLRHVKTHAFANGNIQSEYKIA